MILKAFKTCKHTPRSFKSPNWIQLYDLNRVYMQNGT